ncbi:MAG: thioredoxin [Deltaproteobacteria bacterium]|nr:MAG: thioredoxin [Deltaproteobacteria bacterium]
MTIRKHYITWLTLIAAGLICAAPAIGESISWTPYDTAEKLAETSGKVRFLYFYTDHCGYCRKIEAETFADAGVAAYINDHFVPIKINAGKNRNLAASFFVRGVPATWVIPDKSKPIKLPGGYIPPDRLMPILKYFGTGSYKTMTFNAFQNAS